MSDGRFFVQMEEDGSASPATSPHRGGNHPPAPPFSNRMRQESTYITPEDEQGLELLAADIQAREESYRSRVERGGKEGGGGGGGDKKEGGRGIRGWFGRKGKRGRGGEAQESSSPAAAAAAAVSSSSSPGTRVDRTPSGLASGRQWLSLGSKSFNVCIQNVENVRAQMGGCVRTLTLPKEGEKLETEMNVKDLLRYIQNAVRRVHAKECAGGGSGGYLRPGGKLVSVGKHTPRVSSSAQQQQQQQSQFMMKKSFSAGTAGIEGGGGMKRADSEPFVTPVVERTRSGSLHIGGMLNARDIRRLVTGLDYESKSPRGKEMSIAVRVHTIVLNLDELRCLILWDRLIVVIPEGADSNCFSKLEENLRWLRMQKRAFTIGDYHEEEFEFLAFEAVLMTMVGNLQASLHHLRPSIASNSQALLGPHTVDTMHQDRLRQLKNRVAAYQSKAKSLHKALLELLDHEDNVKQMHLTALARHRQNKKSEEVDPEIDDDEAEDLLESYLGDVHEIVMKWELVKEDMQNTEEYVLMKLDMARNKLLTLGAVLDLINVSFAFGNLVAAIFGMNLLNGISSNSGDPGTYDDFLWTTCTLGFLMLSSIAFTLVWMWRKHLLVT